MARDLADSLILPFNVTDYSDALSDLSDTLLEQFETLMKDNGVNTGNVNLNIYSCFLKITVKCFGYLLFKEFVVFSLLDTTGKYLTAC